MQVWWGCKMIVNCLGTGQETSIKQAMSIIISRMDDLNTQLRKEFEKAQQARINKNEGQARVCARRAAGIAIREYLTRKGTQVPSMSAYDLLNLLKEDTLPPPEIQLIVDHLTVRVTEDFELPVDADLIAEARILCNWLLDQ
jgi:hypothetical protein